MLLPPQRICAAPLVERNSGMCCCSYPAALVQASAWFIGYWPQLICAGAATIASFHVVDPVAAYLMIPTQVWHSTACRTPTHHICRAMLYISLCLYCHQKGSA